MTASYSISKTTSFSTDAAYESLSMSALSNGSTAPGSLLGVYELSAISSFSSSTCPGGVFGCSVSIGAGIGS